MAVLTYWQVYLIAAGVMLAAFWAGWAARALEQRRALAAPAGRHARGAARAPGPLPELPAAAAATLELRHANAMARHAPRPVRPAVAAAAAVAALSRAIGQVTITAHILALWASRDRPGARPWGDATGSMPAVMAELEQDQAHRWAA